MGLDIGEELEAEVLLATVECGSVGICDEWGAADTAALEEGQHPLASEGIGHNALEDLSGASGLLAS